MRKLLLSVALISGCASTEHIDFSSTKISQYGISPAAETVSIYTQAEEPNNQVLITRSNEFTQKTDIVPAKIGIQFGFCFEIKSNSSSISITREIKHPKLTMPNGTEFSSSKYTKKISVKDGTAESCMAYLFEESWETVAGRWNFAIYHNEKLLAQKTFIVQ
ncbi:DUF3859 domain-containing protein [Spongorhabdus nitratireducens]